MAKHNCAICGAEIGLMSSQKLADGNYICRKNCRSRGLKEFDFIHADLPSVKAHHAQVEFGTKVWEQLFVPLRKTKEKDKKLKEFGDTSTNRIYVSESLGLIALVENRYKFFIFGKSAVACVFRIADLYGYTFENELKTTSDGKSTTQNYAHLTFRDVQGLNDFRLALRTAKEFESLEKYFNALFGIQKTLTNVGNTWKNQMNAIKATASTISSAMKGNVTEEQATAAMDAVELAQYGDRIEWIRRAVDALSTVQ